MSYDSKVPDRCTQGTKFSSVCIMRTYLYVLYVLYVLYARMNNFSPVQAFLATALAFTAPATTARNIRLIAALFNFTSGGCSRLKPKSRCF